MSTKVKGEKFDNNDVRLECPYCGEIHKHSGFGFRESHCYPGGFYHVLEEINV